MLNRILHWIYCLPLWQAFLLALIATGVFLWLRYRNENSRRWRWILLGLLLCWLAVVLLQTILRERGNTELSLVPFQCYITVLQGGEEELLRSAFMNVFLFYPGGLILQSLWKRSRIFPLLLIFFLASVVIEVCQYGFGLGTAETDDVIHNTLGACLGVLAARQYEKYVTEE